MLGIYRPGFLKKISVFSRKPLFGGGAGLGKAPASVDDALIWCLGQLTTGRVGLLAPIVRLSTDIVSRNESTT